MLVPGILDAQPRKHTRGRATAAPVAATDTQTLAVQVALDRAGFSPGEIDGQGGAKTRLALSAYQATNHAEPTAVAEPIISYTITQADVAGPFIGSMPKDMMEAAKLPAFGYTTPLEALAEKFHSSQAFLRRLNPQASWEAGEVIKVPDVESFEIPVKAQAKPAAARGTTAKPAPAAKESVGPVEVVLNGATKSLIVRDAGGRVLMHAPMTSGSEHDPLPVGDWKVTGVSWNPAFNYNPDLFWDANPTHSKATIPAGPNNPVGVVWVDINKEHFGLHGTPEPSTIGRTESHGCVRLTNWDATRLGKLVAPGTKVTIQ